MRCFFSLCTFSLTASFVLIRLSRRYRRSRPLVLPHPRRPLLLLLPLIFPVPLRVPLFPSPAPPRPLAALAPPLPSSRSLLLPVLLRFLLLPFPLPLLRTLLPRFRRLRSSLLQLAPPHPPSLPRLSLRPRPGFCVPLSLRPILLRRTNCLRSDFRPLLRSAETSSAGPLGWRRRRARRRGQGARRRCGGGCRDWEGCVEESWGGGCGGRGVWEWWVGRAENVRQRGEDCGRKGGETERRIPVSTFHDFLRESAPPRLRERAY